MGSTLSASVMPGLAHGGTQVGRRAARLPTGTLGGGAVRALFVIAVGLVIVATLGSRPDCAAGYYTVGSSTLHGSDQHPRGSGKALLSIYPRHGRVRISALRHMPSAARGFFVVWLRIDPGTGFVGGAFPRNAVPLGLDTIVPGRTPVSHANLRAADRIVVSVLDRQRARGLYRRGEQGGWGIPRKIRGQRILRGVVTS